VVDPNRAIVSYASAGHPPPLLVTPDGEVSFLEGARSWPLGVDVARSRGQAASAALPPGSLLLLYTDGLVERRGESISTGLERLRTVVAQHWNLPLRRLKQAIFGRLVDDMAPVANDDIALVALRTVGSGQLFFADAFHASHTELAPARHRLRDWLDNAGVPVEPRDRLTLAVGEAVANAIDHGSRGDESQIVKVEVALRGSTIMASVSDSGSWQPGIEGFFTGRGRGHLLMQAFTDDVDIDTDQQGTIVTLRLTMQEAVA
jgi:anti-sigma regulatory factor (Ser/Thr protein kinase)